MGMGTGKGKNNRYWLFGRGIAAARAPHCTRGCRRLTVIAVAGC